MGGRGEGWFDGRRWALKGDLILEQQSMVSIRHMGL
jgi:hypothetical protein